jgi:proton-coupled amino acid transporter
MICLFLFDLVLLLLPIFYFLVFNEYINQIGAFRRDYISTRAERQGQRAPTFLAQNFLDFLVLYGSYGGDIHPEDDDSSDDEIGDLEVENQPLLPRAASVSRLTGTASPRKAFFLIMKAFVGTGVLFLPKAFANGGLLLSAVLISSIASLTLYCIILFYNV